MRFIVVTGGVVSGLGKGTLVSALCRNAILANPLLGVTNIKIDPYLNVDAKYLSPSEHGEVYVLRDGGEVDLDFGNYERATGVTLSRDHSITSGKVYRDVLLRERTGGYGGKTVTETAVVQEIYNKLVRAAHLPVQRPGKPAPHVPDVCVVEIGGTIEDTNNVKFIRAVSLLAADDEHEVCVVHVCPVLRLPNGEWKTKPAQNSVKALLSTGLIPAVLAVRSSGVLPAHVLSKLSAAFPHLTSMRTWTLPDCADELGAVNIRRVIPVHLLQKASALMQGAAEACPPPVPLTPRPTKWACVAIVGKYARAADAYQSVIAALHDAADAARIKIRVKVYGSDRYADAEQWVRVWDRDEVTGVMLPGGFGTRGVEDKVMVASTCRANRIPFLGVCLGFQCAVLSILRDLGGAEWANATSAECTQVTPARGDETKTKDTDETKTKAAECDEAKTADMEGATSSPRIAIAPLTPDLAMRVGEVAITQDAEGPIQRTSSMRYRHRYVVTEAAEEALCAISGVRATAHSARFRGSHAALHRMEFIGEEHPHFVGVQGHPEFGSTPFAVAEDYLTFVTASSREFKTCFD